MRRRDVVTLPTVGVSEEALSNFFEVNGFDDMIDEILNTPEIETACRNTVKLIRWQLRKVLNATKKESLEYLSVESLKEDLTKEIKMLAIKEAIESFFSGEETDMMEAIENEINEMFVIEIIEAEINKYFKYICRKKARDDFDKMISATTISK